MPRQPRSFHSDGCYHIYNRGNNKKQVFLSDSDYLRFLSLLEELKFEHGFFLYHYVLMPNHFHLVISPGDSDLSIVMHRLQSAYARIFSKKNEHVGHVWQSRFKSVLIDSDAYLFACGNYVEMNPVRAGLVDDPRDWKWTSYRYYAFGEQNQLVDEDPFFRGLANRKDHRQVIYQKSVEKTRA